MSIQQVLMKSFSLVLWVVYCIPDVNETPVSDSAVGMKGTIENHLANIGTQINPAASHNAVL